MIDELLLDTASGKRSYKACPSWEHKERAVRKNETHAKLCQCLTSSVEPAC